MQLNYTVRAALVAAPRDITVKYNTISHEVTSSLSSAELIGLYRRLPFRFEAHDYELTPSALLLRTLAECMNHAYKHKIAAEAEAPKSQSVVTDASLDLEANSPSASHGAPNAEIYNHYINFYNGLFKALDAFADLEEKVNRFDDISIDNLHAALTSYSRKMQDVFSYLVANNLNDFIGNEHQQRYQQYVEDCSRRILNQDVTNFRKNINDNKNDSNIKALLSAYTRNNEIKSLGEFVIEQVKRIQNLLEDYHRLQEHFNGQEDYVETSAAMQKIKVLRADSLAFQESCAGVQYASGQPYSPKIIEFLRVVSGNVNFLTADSYQVVLNDFIASQKRHDLNEWEKLFSLIEGEKPKTVGYANTAEASYYTFAIIFTSIIEVAATVFLRFPINLLIGFFLATYHAVLELIDILPCVNHPNFSGLKQDNEARVANITVFFDLLHHSATSGFGLSAFRRERDYVQIIRYLQERRRQNDPRTQLISAVTAEVRSSLAYTAAETLSPQLVYEKVLRGYESIGEFFYTPTVRDPHYLFEKIKYWLKPEQQASVFEKLLHDLQSPDHQVPKALFALAGCEIPEVITNPVVDQEGNSHLTSGVEAAQHHHSAFIRASDLVIHVHPAQSIMNFVEMLALEFSSLINGIFVKLPLASTLAEFFAFVTFSAAYLNMGGPLPILLNDISRCFTGAEVVESDVRKMIAAFLLWKIAVVGIECIFAIPKLDFRFLERLYGDPERVFLIISTFLGLGLLIQLFPLLPETINLFSRGISGILFGMYPQVIKDFCNGILSIYPSMVNLFIIEAREAWHGQIPFNFLEYFFLGLKSVFLIGALFSGRHEPHLHKNPVKHETIVQALANMHDIIENKVLAAQYIINLYKTAGLKMNRNAAQHLYDFLSVNNGSSDVLDDLYNQFIFKGSNNFLQILFLLPGFFITYPYRAIKYTFGAFLGASVMQHEVIKNIYEDITMFMSVATALSENFRSFILSLNQVFKFLFALIVGVPLHYLGVVDFKDFNRGLQKTFDMENHLLWAPKALSTSCTALVNNPYSFKSVYGVVTHNAGNEKRETQVAVPNRSV